MTELGAPQSERSLDEARRAFDGPIRQVADYGYAPRREFVEAVRAVAELMIAAGHSQMVYDDPYWQGTWTSKKPRKTS